MWIADGWKDYEVIDTSNGEKLERWGDYLLVRPDPQVIWDTNKAHKGWRTMNGHYHRSKKGGGEWEFFDLPQQWQIHYKSLTFNLKPFSFKHTGLFPEQATNWDWFSEKIKKAGRRSKYLTSSLTREEPLLRRRLQVHRSHMWTHQREWLHGRRRTLFLPD